MDEEKEQEEKETFTRKAPRPVAVKIVARKGKSVLVEWPEGDDLRRGFIPVDKLDGQTVDPGVLGKAIPYGVPWAELVDMSAATPADFQAEMHRHGIWTRADLEAKPKVLRTILFNITGINLGALHGAAKKHEQGG